jgi:Secretion system C-terminal sorting domain
LRGFLNTKNKMTMKLKITILLLLSILNLQSLMSQTWQWGQSGGGSSDDFGSSLANETVYKMGTDAKGNLYVAWVGFGGGTKIGGDTLSGVNGNEDCMISKFTCNGIHQWTKVIGNDIFRDDFTGFGVDSLGNTYSQVTGYDDGFYGFNIDTDTTFLDPIHNLGNYATRWWLIKYDSAGVLQWYKAPESDTATIPKGYGFDMEVMNDGTFYSYDYIRQNAILNGSYAIQNKGYYLLKFDNQGNILSHTPIASTLFTEGRLHIPKSESRFYLSSTQFNTYFGKDTVGSIPIQGHSAICAFDMQGNQLWVSQFPDTSDFNDPNFVANTKLRGKITTDLNGNIYFGVISGIGLNNSAVIAGFSLYNDTNKVTPVSNYGSAETIFKIDSNGNYVWHNNEFQIPLSQNEISIEVNGQKIIESNPYIKTKKGGFSLRKNFIFGVDAPNYYLAEIDINSGQYTKVDSLVCLTANPPNFMNIGSIHADKNGQVYIGAQFPQNIVIAGTTFNAIGGKTDMFIAKWGDTCEANLLSTEDTKFKIQNLKMLEVFPNPASKEINLSFNQKIINAEILIYDVMGKKVYSEKLKSNFKTTINTSQLQIGMYNVVLNSNGKLITSKKLIIER